MAKSLELSGKRLSVERNWLKFEPRCGSRIYIRDIFDLIVIKTIWGSYSALVTNWFVTNLETASHRAKQVDSWDQ